MTNQSFNVKIIIDSVSRFQASKSIVESLLLHPSSRHFCHDYQHQKHLQQQQLDDDIKTETGARGQNLSGDENVLSEDDHENIDVVTECNFEEYSELSSLDGSIPSSLASSSC